MAKTEKALRRAESRRRRNNAVFAFIDGAFFLLAGVAALWLLWLVFKLEGSTKWVLAVYLVALWGILAYWVLPRVHKLLTSMYVPNYFIGRSRTDYGLLGDPINLAFDGSADNIHRVMQAAGWTLAEPVNMRTSLKIIGATLAGKSYQTAPVSTLTVFDRMQDFAYQKEVAGSPGKRHHIRFWKCPPDWPLPGGVRVDWVAAATYDRKVGLSLFTLQVTHKIDADIDGERNYVISSIESVDPDLQVQLIEDFSTAYHHRNGGGDLIQTDGDLPVVNLEHIPSYLPEADLAAISANAGEPDVTSDNPKEQLAKIPRPMGVYGALAMLLMLMVAQVVTIFRLVHTGTGLDTQNEPATQAILIGTAALEFVLLGVLSFGIWDGRRGARQLLILTVGLEIIYLFWKWMERDQTIDTHTGVLNLAIAVLLLVALTSTPVGDFARARAKWRKDRRAYLKTTVQP